MNIFKDLFGSKKFVVLLVNILATIFNEKLGLGLEIPEIVSMHGSGGLYFIGQGMADNGKEAVREQARVDPILSQKEKMADKLSICVPFLLLLGLQSCTSPAVARVSVRSAIDQPPSVDARFDGNTFVGYGTGIVDSEVFGKDTGLPIWGPIVLPVGRVLVMRASPKTYEEYRLRDPLPFYTRVLFRENEITQMGLTFSSDAVPILEQSPAE